jgi:hypothetical protein
MVIIVAATSSLSYASIRIKVVAIRPWYIACRYRYWYSHRERSFPAGNFSVGFDNHGYYR